MSGAHVPVMLEEVMAVLQPRDDAIYVDGTFGGGGYSEALLSRARCKVFGIDRDAAAIARGRGLAQKFDGRLTLIHGRFSEMDALLDAQGVAKADGVALDLGVSSFQFEEGERGFSFSADGPLDMRMDDTQGETAADLVNTLSEDALADILRRTHRAHRAGFAPRSFASAKACADFRSGRQESANAAARRSACKSPRALRAAARRRAHRKSRLEFPASHRWRARMIRTLNFAFVVMTGLVCLGLYRIAEEARVAAADLKATRASIVRENDALTVLGAEWASLTQPGRIQAL